MKRRQISRKTKIMRSPDLFRDSYQSFDLKTGERLSYLDTLILQLDGQPDPEPLEELKNVEQLSLF